MLALAEPGKVLGGDRSGKAKLACQLALPLAGDDAALRPIVLFLGGEFLLVVVLRLARRKRLGDGQHGLDLRPKSEFLLALRVRPPSLALLTTATFASCQRRASFLWLPNYPACGDSGCWLAGLPHNEIVLQPLDEFRL